MSVAHKLHTYAEYLALEAVSEEKHEFLDGEIVAMSGGTPNHALIGANVTMVVGPLARTRGCRSYSADLRIRVPETGLATYPDLAIVCGELETHPEDPHAATNPTVIFEVLSPSTEGYDRGAKFRHYQQLPSLRTYVLVSQTEAVVETFTRQDDGSWTYRRHGPGDVFALDPVDAKIAVDEVFADVEFE